MKAADFLKKTHGGFTFLALVKPRSNISSKWNLEKPGYCIFEFDPAFGEVMIRWGDGSWQRLEEKNELDDLVLLEQFGEQDIERFFDA